MSKHPGFTRKYIFNYYFIYLKKGQAVVLDIEAMEKYLREKWHRQKYQKSLPAKILLDAELIFLRVKFSLQKMGYIKVKFKFFQNL